jgi:Fungal protein of unknown function (DUF1783).
MSVNETPASYSTVAPPPPPPKKSGCLKWGLIGCGSALVLFGIFIVVIIVVVVGGMKSSDAYKEALQRAQNDPAVIAALGKPIEAGFVVWGSAKFDSSGEHKTLDFPISGPKGKAAVHLVATKSGTKWEYSELTVKPESGAVIDLLPPAPATSTEPATTTDTTATDTATSTDTTTTDSSTSTR